MSPFLVHGIEWIITAVLAGIAGYLTSSLRKKHTHDDAMEQGMRVILRKQIVDAYDLYHVKKSAPLTVERRREITEAYEAYEMLNGNGVITDMYHELQEDEIYIATGR